MVSSLAATPPPAAPAPDFEHELEQTVRTLLRLVRGADPAAASGDQARRLVDLFARAERAAASGIALFSPVVVETGSYAKAGHGSAADWLGSVAGTSAGAAKGRLAAAERAEADGKQPKREQQAALVVGDGAVDHDLGDQRDHNLRAGGQ